MEKFYKSKPIWLLGNLLLFVLLSNLSFAQIYAPEGLNIPGTWNGYTNPPNSNSPFGSETQVTNGGVKHITSGQPRWQTTFTGTAGGGFVFTSGNSGSPWSNKWVDVNVTMNTLQSYNYSNCCGADNQITCNASKYYTAVWEEKNPDNNIGTTDGYVGTRAIFMETTNAPVTFTSISQSPLAAAVTSNDAVTVTITTSGSLSPEEIVYLRWTTDNYANSTLVPVTMTGNSGSTIIPMQTAGTTVAYYAFTSTVSSITADYDLQSINSSAAGNYTASDGNVDITFQVDMANEVVSVNGVHVAGTFNGFNTSSIPLTLVSGTTYAAVVSIAKGSNIQYKFLNGNTGGNYETIIGACPLTGGNRTFSVGTVDAPIPLTCYGRCTACPAKVDVKFQVNMSGLTVNGSGVSIAGDFGSSYPTWTPGAIVLTNEGGGIYSTTLQLVPGQVVPYKFINGNAWGQDEGIPGACNVFGNREITVPGSNYNVPLNCFGTCSNCVNVTFQVDMTGLTVSGNGVHVAGAFQGWNPGSTALNYSGTGGIYNVSINMDPNSSSEFKFVNGNAWGSDEGVPGLCNTSGNRTFSVGNSNKVLPVVCFGRCIACDAESAWRGVTGVFGDGNNWTAGVAPNNCNFKIRISDVGASPVINAGSFSTGQLTMTSGTDLTINSGATFNVCGNLAASFSSISGDGTLALNGTSSQSVSGVLNLSNLTLNNTTGANFTSTADVRVSGALKMQSGFLNTTLGKLTLTANSTSQARILKNETGAGITGNVTFQKYLAGINSTSTGGWYFLTSPVVGFTLNGFDQRGNNFHPATFDPANITDPASVFLYSQNAGSSFDDFGWAKSNNPSQAVGNGQGVRVWVRKNTDESIMEFTGVPTSGPVTLPVTYCAAGCSYPSGGSTNGWNLVANPYACTIDWNAVSGWTKTGISGNATHIWNAATGVYATYDGVVGLNGGTNTIAGGQGFIVQATSGAASLQLTEDVKVNSYTSGMRTAVAELSGVRIKLSTTTSSDEAWLDLTADRLEVGVSKLQNPGVTLALGNSPKYCIAGLNKVNSNGDIPLFVKNTNGTITFSFEKSGSNMANVTLYIKDQLNGTLQEITEGNQTFSFSASNIDENRFSLVISQSVTGLNDLKSQSVFVWPNPAKDQLTVSSSVSGQAYVIRNVMGQTLVSDILKVGQSVLSVKELPAGTYMISFPETGKTVRFNKN